MTKQIGKTLTSIGESPDQRGQQKLLRVQNPQFEAPKVDGDRIFAKNLHNDQGLESGKAEEYGSQQF
jgi:hypothetical protein